MVGWVILVTNLYFSVGDTPITLWTEQAMPTMFDSLRKCESFLLDEMKQSKLNFEIYYSGSGKVHVKSKLFKQDGLRMHTCALIESSSSIGSNIFKKR